MMPLFSFFILSTQILIFGTIGRIQKALQKKEYEKAIDLIYKGYEKESNNPGISYYHSKLLFDKSYDQFNLDSARVVIEIAKEKYDLADSEIIEELSKEGIGIREINVLYEQIRDSAFRKANAKLSISTALSFQKKFPNSIYEDILILKVDSIKYGEALAMNSEEAMLKFIEENPQTIYRPAADSIVDDFRFQKLLSNNTLKANYAFHQEYPKSRHLDKTEKFILKHSTASHTQKSYQDFIQFTNSKRLKKKAADVLFYLTEKKDYELHPFLDSIQLAQSNLDVEVYPVIQNGLFGFFDRTGLNKIQHKYSSTAETYKCELTSDDWIYVRDESSGIILTKNGAEVLNTVEDYRSISNDVGLVKKHDQWYLYHKSGFQIIDKSIDDATIIANKWIKVRKDNKWGLFSFMGLQVAELIYDEIAKMESFWVFKKNGRIALTNERLILEEIEDRGISLEFKFDDIELVDENALIGFKGDKECLLDSTLNFRVPWGLYEIYPEAAGWYLKSDQGYRLYSESESDIIDQYYSYLESNVGWLALKTQSDWILVPRQGELPPSRGYDSVKLINEFASLVFEGNSKNLVFSSGKKISITNERIRTFQNQPEIISITSGDQSLLINQSGETLISEKYEKAIFLNDSLLQVQKRGKQGLLHINGRWILNPVFDSIDEKDGLILTLLKGKIGCYDPSISTLITTEYEARLLRMRNHYLAKKNGKFGIIDSVKNEIVSFNYDEIQYWNDTSYLVKKENQYLIIDSEEESLYPTMEDMKLTVENMNYKIYRFVKNGKYGLVSNQYGELLSPDFTDIFNIGSSDNPLIFADQHLDKARFHVVSYVDEKGNLVLSKAYTSEEFEDILCDE